MSRIDKKSRIKRLPPIIQLQLKDSITGSYPTILRFSTDGRLGNYKISYNDTNTLNFVFQTGSNSLDPLPDIPLSNLYTYYAISSSNTSSSPSRRIFPPSYGFPASVIYGGSQANNSLYLSSVNPSNISYSTNIPYTNSSYSNRSLLFTTESGKTGLTGSITLYDFSPHKPFSISLWTKANQTGVGIVSGCYYTARANILPVNLATKIDYFLFRFQNSNNTLLSGFLPSATSFAFKTFNIPSLGLGDLDWHHITFTYDGNIFDGTVDDEQRIKIYFDTIPLSGALSRNNMTNAPIVMSGGIQNFLVGNHGINSNLAQYSVWDKELSLEEIKAIYYNTSNFETNDQSSASLLNGTGINYGTNLPVGNKFLEETSKNQTNLFGSGFVKSGIGDSIVHFTPGQEMTPYTENKLWEVDGLSNNNVFFATGSTNVNFDEPLWAKKKITINLTPENEQEFSINRVSSSYNTIYWNNVLKQWEGIGGADIFDNYKVPNAGNVYTDLLPYGQIFFNNKATMTNPGFLARSNEFYEEKITNDYRNNMGSFIENFGFPYHDKFHATSSQLIDMSEYISEAFRAEKFVVELDCELTCSINTTISMFPDSSMTSFVIMNQRTGRPFNQKLINIKGGEASSFPTINPINTDVSFSFSSLKNRQTMREVVGRVNLFGSESNNFSNRNANYYFNSTCWNTSGSIVVSGNLGHGSCESNLSQSVSGFIRVHRNSITHLETKVFSGSLGYKSPRKETLADSKVISSSINETTDFKFHSYDRHYSNTSYTFMPTDKLLFSFAIPYPSDITTVDLDQALFILHNKPTKITIYGSYIEKQKEENDSMNQLLSSETINEVIQ